jgi:MoaA/NifB/PqqE/SkfB family radical SAM enzyme
VLSDGKVVCGCADPYGERPLGNINETPIKEIWNGETALAIRRGLNGGYAPFCINCGLKQYVDEQYDIPKLPEKMETLPRLFIEPTVVCNISCFKAVCNIESGIVGTRRRKMMPFDEFKTLVDSVGHELVRIDLFNYGDPFVHPKCVDMIEYVKSTYPDIYLYLSTNGLLLNEDKIRRIIDAGLDEITFSVDGPDQETYVKYRCGGDFEKVTGLMRMIVKMRDEKGRHVPFINWRYILFKWNSSDEQMERTRRLAEETGVDKLVWEITDHPAEAASEKYQIGTPAWEKIYYEIWDTSQTCNALPHQRLLAEIFPPDDVIRTRRNQSTTVSVLSRNTGGALWRRAVPGFRRSVRLGAQLYDSGRNLIDLNFARAFLPANTAFNETAIIDIDLPGISHAGKYQLRFDMSYEGIDWFDSGGSEVAWAELLVT